MLVCWYWRKGARRVMLVASARTTNKMSQFNAAASGLTTVDLGRGINLVRATDYCYFCSVFMSHMTWALLSYPVAAKKKKKKRMCRKM